MTLEKLAINELFAQVFGYESSRGAKPGSGTILEFCWVAGLPTKENLMVGNTLAGRGAGYRLVVAVLTGASQESLMAPLTNIALPSIAELPKLLVC